LKSYLINKLTPYRGGKTTNWIFTPVSNCLIAYWMNKEIFKQMHGNTMRHGGLSGKNLFRHAPRYQILGKTIPSHPTLAC
jgi:hypothetical protein